MQGLYFALIALCIIAAYACELCNWPTMAIVLAVDLVGIILSRRYIEIPGLSKFIAVILWIVFLGIELSYHPGIQVFFLNIFLNLVWAMLAYRALNHSHLLERLQVGILSLLPLACVAIKLQASTFLTFLFAYLVIWMGFLSGQSLTAPNTGTQAYSQNQTRGLTTRFWLTTALILMMALLAGSLLFMVVPRYGNHSVSPVPSLEKVSGQFPDVALDKTGEIKVEPTLIFRADVPAKYEDDEIYWRIDVQNIFNGTQWFSMGASKPTKNVQTNADDYPPEDAYHIEFTQDWRDFRVPALINTEYIEAESDTPDNPSQIKFNQDNAGVWRRLGWTRKAPLKAMDYWLDEDQHIELNRESFDARMIWPGRRRDDSTQRLTELAKSIVGDADSNEAKAIKIRDYLRQKYSYSLNRPQRTGYIVEDFLYRQPIGHCEVFSTTMAVLLARLDVPVRNVSGFVSHEFHDDQNYVRAAHAHSWVEVWLDSTRGWTVFDPTPSGPQEIDIDWRVRFDDWFSSYQTRDLYRWMQQNGLQLLAFLLGLAALFALLRWPVRGIRIRLMPVDELCQRSWDNLNQRINPHSALKQKTLESWWSEDCPQQYLPVKALALRLIQVKYRPNIKRRSSWQERFKFNHETLKLLSRAIRSIQN